MKITNIKYLNNDRLGNLELDLSKKGKGAYDKIIIVGNNGSGKTTILNDLFCFLNKYGLHMNEITYINDSRKSLKLIPINNTNYDSYTMGGHIIIDDGKQIENLQNHVMSIRNQPIEKNDLDIRKNGVIYSTVNINFLTQKITNISSTEIDSKNSDETNEVIKNTDFTKVKQLLIDIYQQDAIAYYNSNNNFTKDTFNEHYSKIRRFKESFDNFFENIKFIGVENINGEQQIIFNKNGKYISIDNLSSGEKQIVFRGTYILRNIRLHGNGFVLIDEPELSMNPKWQDKLLDYYSDLLFKGDNPIGQLFIATHSERILRSALSKKNRDNTLVVEIHNENGSTYSIRHDSPLILPYLSDAEINKNVFGVYSNDLFLELYDCIQNYVFKTSGTSSIKKTDDYILQHPKFNNKIHSFHSTHNSVNYETKCTAIRNCLCHGNPDDIVETELISSIDLMTEIIKNP